MATTSEAASAARWDVDPYARFELRYFDGTQWTEHVISGGRQSTSAPETGPQTIAAPQGQSESTATDQDYYVALGQIVEAREAAKRAILIWGAVVIVVAGISLASYSSASAGDSYFVWWGPVAFGLYRITRAALVLFRLRNA